MKFSVLSAKLPRALWKPASVLAAVSFLLGVFVFDVASAQQSPNVGLDSEQIQQILQGRQPGSSVNKIDQSGTQEVILEPTAPVSSNLPASRLEDVMSARSGTRLQQFGYDQFGVGRPVAISQMGAVQDDYILGPGDEIDVSLRGQENSEYRAEVNRNGQVILPRLNPISAAGRSIGDFRQDVLSAVGRAYVSTQVFVSVSRLRQISVTISGEVTNPGVRLLTGLSTAADAIVISGGVKKTGSLRAIRLVRDGRVIPIDLYSLITQHGDARSVHLADGDRIVVPPLGRTVAVTGWVRLPGIFELTPGASAIAVRNLTSLAGGYEVRGKYHLSVLRLQRDGGAQMTEIGEGGAVEDGEILFVQPAASQTTEQATLSGGTVLAGHYAVGKRTSLAQLIRSPGALGPSPYTMFGIVYRKDPVTLVRTLVAFTPAAVLEGNEDMKLQSDDVVRVFSVSEAQMLRKTMQDFKAHKQAMEAALRNPQSSQTDFVTDAQFLNREGTPQQTPGQGMQTVGKEDLGQQPQFGSQNSQGSAGSSSAAALAAAQNLNPAMNGRHIEMPSGSDADNNEPVDNQMGPSQNLQDQFVSGTQLPTNAEARTFGQLARQLLVDPVVLANFLLDNSATLSGAVRGPGLYVIGPNANLQDLINVAGGTGNWADESGVELISSDVNTQTGVAVTHHESLPLHQGTLASYIVRPRDELRFNEVYSEANAGTITLQGEFRFTGPYSFSRGEHLSSVIMRAGGLTPSAYPYGTIFLRTSVAALEADGYRRAADEIESGLIAGMTRPAPASNAIASSQISGETFGALQGFVADLRTQKSLGRISISADPSVLLAKPELDPLLEPGDVVYVPQRPNTVTVLGQVLQPGSFPYQAGESVQDYLGQAGGYAQFANESLTFVILPNGSAQKVESSWLNFNGQAIPPGSTIVVPRDLSPYDLRQFFIDATQITSQLAISAASLAVLSKQ